ncbi:Hypothetical protein R9X50_00097300 [Acrodontium crateriforme]|uniref:Rhodopsin domain-containing protein n=1 Tax=Acrodontium crateriforme TaxID=150365 RepID=A0AAQ3LYV2_9PEZI|nr:Hypothetical protein R9X50_00097300 [Acrodontium crateriforme]
MSTIGLGYGHGARGFSLWITSVVMVILAGAVVVARLLQRWQKKMIWWDDYLITAALCFSVLLTVTECSAVKYGYGRHHSDLAPEDAIMARKWWFGAQFAYKIALMLAKSSICAMYYRFFKSASKWFRWSCHSMQIFIISSGIAFLFGTAFQCRPIAAFWNPSVKHSCFRDSAWWISYAVVQILIDVLLLALPISRVFRMKISSSERFGFIFLFSLGLFATATSIIRATTIATSASNPDITWGPIPATIWAVIEANTTIIVGCLPLLRPVFMLCFTWSTKAMTSYTTGKDVEAGNRLPRRFTDSYSANHVVDISGRQQGRDVELFNGLHGVHMLSLVEVSSERACSDDGISFRNYEAE